MNGTREWEESVLAAMADAGATEAGGWVSIQVPKVCPACRLLKEGDGRLCAYCARAARIQDEENRNA